jgi:IS30 family transposase
MELEPWLRASQGVWRVIDVEDWAEIRRLHRAEGMGIKAIGRRLGVARNTVRDALRSDEPPRYERAGTGSVVDGVEPEIRRLLGEFPGMPATVIAERIGWNRGITVLRDRVAELRPLFVLPDPCQRTHYRPGELAQWDLWQPEVVIPVGFGQHAKLWVVVAVTGFSRRTAVATLVERSTRFLMLIELPGGRTAESVREALAATMPRLPAALRRTLTWDQGKEMAEHVRFTVDTGIQVYFCDPSAPWQRGTNENTNGLLRQYLPKGTDLTAYDQTALDAIADELNGRPRQTLGWMKPSEAFNHLVAMTA